MYVVWKTRDLKRRWCPECGWVKGRCRALIPHLVESRRVNGKPRQVHVARLPSIRSCCLRSDAARGRWWCLANAALRAFTRDEADLVRHKLAEKVSPARDGWTQQNDKEEQTSAPATLREAALVLQLRWPATEAAVKAAFRALAKKHHPDLGGSAGQFRRVYGAYELALSHARNG